MIRRWARTTPGRLRLQETLIAVTAAVLLLTGTGALTAVLITETNVHQQTVGAIVGVQRMHAWMAAADRSAANSYLSGGVELTLPQQQYEADVAAASRELELAAERQPTGTASDLLQSISQAFGEYTRLVDTAMVQHRLNNPDGMAMLKQASDEMHAASTGILAQVEAVEAIYAGVLTRSNVIVALATGVLGVFVLAAAVTIGLLIWTQQFVRRRFRRRRNKRLMAATAAVLVVLAGTGVGAASAQTSIVRSQAQYSRLLNLWHARSLAYDANGDTSLYLISAGITPGPQDSAFQTDAGQLVDRPLTDELLADAKRGDVRFNGLLADELRAADSQTERNGALQVLTAYRQFIEIDSSVHSQAASGHQSAAVTLTLGTYGAALGLAFKSMDWGPRLGAQRDWSEGELGFAFEEFDWDLAQLTQLIQNEFDGTMSAIEHLVVETLGLQVLSLAVAGLTIAGLRPRIAEYF
jgi:hypothetical protein